MSNRPEVTYHKSNDIKFRIETYYIVGTRKHYCKWYCLSCDTDGTTNEYPNEASAINSYIFHTNNHASYHLTPENKGSSEQ